MAIRLIKSQRINGVDYPAGVAIIGLDLMAESLAMQGGGAVPVNVAVLDTSVQPTALAGPYVLSASDDRMRYYATGAFTVTIPIGLNPRPEVTILPPQAGNLTIQPQGGAQANGAAAAITRTRAANPMGVLIGPWPDVADAYGVSGG